MWGHSLTPLSLVEEDSFHTVSGGQGDRCLDLQRWGDGWGPREMEGEWRVREGCQMMLGNRIFDEGTTGPVKMWFDRRGEFFAFPGAEGWKREGLCRHSISTSPHEDKVFKVGFCYWR